MSRYPDGFLDEVRTAASIVAVVGGLVSLKKVGRSHKGLCPFHQEKTPSFTVDDERGVFHCFGCHAGGDIFKFVMLYEKVTFGEAIRRVAELSGIPLPQVEARPGDDRRERLYALNERALAMYRETLAGAEGAAARAYLERRGIRSETVAAFELGVTPPGWDRVSQALLGQRFRPEEILAVGLAKERPTGKGIYDRFHERLLFPIRSASGRLVGFGGRILAGDGPKYLNSPETEIYSKSDVLYGLSRARDACRAAGHVVVVEGYLDLIALHQAGITEVVATLGTGLTERHARQIQRLVPRAYVAYDPDAAGRTATKRAIRALLAERVAVAVVELEAGLDPDDYVRERGADAFRSRVTGATGFVPYLVAMARAADPAGVRTVEGKMRLVNEVLPVLAALSDPIERALHAGTLAEAAGIEDRVLLEAIRGAAAAHQETMLPQPVAAPATAAGCLRAEVVLVSGLLGSAEVFAAIAGAIDPEDFRDLPTEHVLEVLVGLHRSGQEVPRAAALSRLERAADQELLGRIAVLGIEVTAREAEGALDALRDRRLRRELAALQGQLQMAAPDALDEILKRKQELSRAIDALAQRHDETL